MRKTKADENSSWLSLWVAITWKNTKITQLCVIHTRKNTKITRFPRFLGKFRACANGWNQAFFPLPVNAGYEANYVYARLCMCWYVYEKQLVYYVYARLCAWCACMPCRLYACKLAFPCVCFCWYICIQKTCGIMVNNPMGSAIEFITSCIPYNT